MPSAEDLVIKAQGKGVTNDNHSGKFTSYFAFKGTTNANSDVAHSMNIYCTDPGFDIRAQFDARNAALLFLTDGQCQTSALCTARQHPLAALDWANIQHRAIVYVVKSQIISYNPDLHTFLCKSNWLSKVNKKAKQTSLRQPIQFGVHPLDGGAPSFMSTQQCIDNLKQRSDNILVNTPAGYGKSVFSKLVIKPTLLSMHSAKEVWFTGTTGATAASLGEGGATVHSKAGVGRGRGIAKVLVQLMKKAPKDRWKHLKVLFVEECSLMSAAFLDMLDEVAKILKGNNTPFGGVRVILVGDMAQLPPIPQLEPLQKDGKRKRKAAKYLFESSSFKAGDFVCLRLGHCWRYDRFGVLGKLLARLRTLTTIDQEMVDALNNLIRHSTVDIDQTVVLCCNKKRARARSLAKLGDMAGEEMQYFGVDRKGAAGPRSSHLQFAVGINDCTYMYLHRAFHVFYLLICAWLCLCSTTHELFSYHALFQGPCSACTL